MVYENEKEELWDLMYQVSEDSFSAGWYTEILTQIHRLISGKPWCDGDFDEECCPAPGSCISARLGFLVGKLGGCWNWKREWVPLSEMLDATRVKELDA